MQLSKTCPRRPVRRLAALAGAVMLACMGSTATAPPATAFFEKEGGGWLNIVPREQEAAIGAEQHQQVVAEFGGVYRNDQVASYVAEIGHRLANASGTTGINYVFTVLDSPVVNAFALPGGYVYITRGLIALANNEAELAGVIAHEMGHVIARHGTQRMTRGVLAELGTMILGSVFDSPAIGDIARTGAGVWMSGYSREQEREADSLAVRYLKAAGYPPIAMASFLGTMGQMDELQRKIGGSARNDGFFALLATHPSNAERVQLAIAEAGGNTERAWQGALGFGRDVYLNRIDGMVYGDSPAQGFIRDHGFIHPEMGFAFSVPQGFNLTNTPAAVLIRGPDNAQGVFDADMRSNPTPAGGDPAVYIRDVWTGQQPVQGLERITIDGLPAATATANVRTSGGDSVVRLVAIRTGDRFYRFQFAAPQNRSAALAPAFRQIAISFRQLSPAEARSYQPERLRVLPVRSGETSQSFAAASALEEPKLERFRVLNGLRAGEEIAPGERVKTVQVGAR